MELCDKNCNECPIIHHGNSRMVSYILNRLIDVLGEDKVYPIVQAACTNLTCCADCNIDDFCHFDGCKIIEAVEEEAI